MVQSIPSYLESVDGNWTNSEPVKMLRIAKHPPKNKKVKYIY